MEQKVNGWKLKEGEEMRKADPREKIPVATCRNVHKGLEKELQTFQDNIKELRSVNEEARKARHDARVANIVSLTAIIIGTTVMPIMLR